MGAKCGRLLRRRKQNNRTDMNPLRTASSGSKTKRAACGRKINKPHNRVEHICRGGAGGDQLLTFCSEGCSSPRRSLVCRVIHGRPFSYPIIGLSRAAGIRIQAAGRQRRCSARAARASRADRAPPMRVGDIGPAMRPASEEVGAKLIAEVCVALVIGAFAGILVALVYGARTAARAPGRAVRGCDVAELAGPRTWNAQNNSPNMDV